MSCGVGCRCGSDLALLWLWRRPAATAPIRPLAWEPPYAPYGSGPRNGKKTKKKKPNKQTKNNELWVSVVYSSLHMQRWGRKALGEDWLSLRSLTAGLVPAVGMPVGGDGHQQPDVLGAECNRICRNPFFNGTYTHIKAEFLWPKRSKELRQIIDCSGGNKNISLRNSWVISVFILESYKALSVT